MILKKQYTFYQGTTTWQECLILFSYIFRPWMIKRGPYAKLYSEKITEYLGANTTVLPFASGRMALFAILKTLGFPQGSDVLLPAYTCTVVPHAIIYAGLHPIYADIETETFSLDIEDLKKKITTNTKAIILPHNFGIPAKFLPEIIQECKDRKIVLIEDCSIALGAEYHGRKVGTWGEAAIFSTDHSKIISTSIGGFAVVNEKKLAASMKDSYRSTPHLGLIHCIRIIYQFIYFYLLTSPYIYPFNHLLDKIIDLFHMNYFFFLSEDKNSISLPTKYPYPAKLPDMLARIGISQLNNIEKNISHRRQCAFYYQKHFLDERNHLILNNIQIKPVYLRYSLVLNKPDQTLFNKELRGFLSANESWFTSIAQGRYDHFEKIGYNIGSCPIAEDMTKRIISLPTHLRINPVKLLKEIDSKKTLMHFFEKHLMKASD